MQYAVFTSIPTGGGAFGVDDTEAKALKHAKVNKGAPDKYGYEVVEFPDGATFKMNTVNGSWSVDDCKPSDVRTYERQAGYRP